ncbi:NADH-quinone oxidoreductase subunit C [uncultured Lamprocystis sp.]|jgi:Ni,Fe-hydrogenase III large subunit/Ni,Fe-hydrogenase III component G|uniref:hydrogenase large subunit n=1 Tax=uncultured Lamprocystis sp. TaxID=543132 RepID=UPI0025EB2995|nr:NADH-quinone oxidoreductase subunit C [uncultured Lamprocystis sp.]
MRKELEAQLAAQLRDEVVCVEKTDQRTIFIDVKREAIRRAARIVTEAGGRYMCGVGYDNIARDGTLGMVHTFSMDRNDHFICVRTKVPAIDPVMESITPDLPSAGWSEREFMDMLGMQFTNHPKPKRLVLADDWPAGIYPLRKEVPYDLVPPGADDVAYQLDEAPPGTKIVPIGPFHPSLHEPEHFAVYVDGETIKGCDYRGFMTHRGIEKLCQTQVSYNEVPFIAERICGICGSVHATAFSQAVESAGGIKIPRRAEYIRTLMLEIERIHSHLLWLGVAGHLIGFDTVFMQAWRVREQLMWLCERLTGNRKTYGMVLIGGVRRDITPEIADDIRAVVKKIEEELRVIHRAIEKDSSIHKRTKGVGTITKEETIAWGLIGPVARARGVDIDARRDHPYAAYNDMKFDVPVLTDCDVWSTLVVRVLETYEAIRIIHQVLDKMPAGPIFVELKDKIPALRHAITTVEAPRGESTHYVITGEDNRPDRWRVRAPTYTNLQAVPLMLLNEQFGDFPIIMGSIDPCFSCTDRVAVIDLQSGKASSMTRRELEFLSREQLHRA